MIEKWIQSVFIKRALLSFATGAAAYVAAHSMPGLEKLSMAGVTVTIKIDPQKLADWLTVGGMAAGQGLHEWIAAKWPELGKYL